MNTTGKIFLEIHWVSSWSLSGPARWAGVRSFWTLLHVGPRRIDYILYQTKYFYDYHVTLGYSNVSDGSIILTRKHLWCFKTVTLTFECYRNIFIWRYSRRSSWFWKVQWSLCLEKLQHKPCLSPDNLSITSFPWDGKNQTGEYEHAACLQWWNSIFKSKFIFGK